VSRFLGEVSLSKGASKPKGEDGRVEGDVIEAFSNVLTLLVHLLSSGLDSVKNVDNNFHGILALDRLIVLSKPLRISLALAQLISHSLLKGLFLLSFFSESVWRVGVGPASASICCCPPQLRRGTCSGLHSNNLKLYFIYRLLLKNILTAFNRDKWMTDTPGSYSY
jgi:hypothetical protein